MQGRSDLRRHLWVLLACVGLAVLLTWPLPVHFTTHVPGDGIDDPSLAWNLWWAKHALVDRPQNPFACDWIFWPVGINLAFYTLTLLNGLLAIPLAAVFGVVPAYNVELLLSFVLSGYGAYLLSLDFLAQPGRQGGRAVRHAAAFAGGVLYAFASAKFFYAALGQGNVASSQWAPLAALYLLRLARPGGRPRDAVLAALFMVLQAYAEQTFASFLVIFAALVGAWRLIGLAMGPRHAAPGPRRGAAPLPGLLLRFGLLAALFLAGIAPFLANMLPDLRAEGDFFTSGGGFADVFSADLAGYLFPTQLHPLIGPLARQAAAGHFPIDKGQQIYVGYVALALAVLGLVASRSRGRAQAGDEGKGEAGDGRPGGRFWAISAGLFFLLTLGPTLRVAGHDTGLPLPFVLVAQLPFFKGNRYPSRYSVMLLMSLAPLVARGVCRLLQSSGLCGPARRAGVISLPHTGARLPRPVYGVVLALLLLEHLSVPLPLSDLRVPDLYQRVAQEPGDFALLELPPGWRNGALVLGKQDTVIMREMWYQTAHGKRLLGGNTSRNPEFKFQYFAEDPTLARLLAPTRIADLAQNTALKAEVAGRPITDAERLRARSWAAFLRLRFVMVHRDRLPAEAEQTLQALLPVRLLAEAGNLALYALDTPDPPTAFAPGTDAGRMALAEGWSPPALPLPGQEPATPSPVWAERSEARLVLPLGGARRLGLYARAPLPGQTVDLVVDGQRLGQQPLGPQPAWITFTLPAAGGRPPLSDVRLRFAGLAPVGALNPNAGAPDQPGPGAGLPGDLPALLVRSAGAETGDFAHIYVNGVDRSPGLRGYNLVALTGEANAGVRAASFDTHGSASASAALAAWVSALPPGTVVAGAVSDEGSQNLKAAAVQALQSLGVAGDLRGHFRWGQAFIGRKGAAPGTALEALDGLRPAQVSLGVPASAPQVAAALLAIQVQR